MPPLRYSDRLEMTEQGSLGSLEFDVVPHPLRRAIVSIYQHAARAHTVGGHFDTQLTAHCSQHFGREFFPWTYATLTIESWVMSGSTGCKDVLDLVEILVEEATTPWQYPKSPVSSDTITYRAYPGIEQRLNTMFERHRFGYRLDGGQVRRIGSPALDESIVRPALLVTSRPGWDAVDRSFRDALHHRLGGPDEREAAITDAHSALEAAMKAAGLKGNQLSALAKDFRNSGIVLPQLEGVPDLLDKLLKRSSSLRDSLSDAHGKAPGSEPVPDGVVDLAIYWTGAFINYLAEASERGTV